MEPVEKRRITDYIDGFCIDSYETYEDLKENLLEPQGVKKAINTKTSPLPASREADSFPSSSSFVEAEIPRATDSADQGVQPINLDFSLNERGSVGSSSLDPLSTGEIKHVHRKTPSVRELLVFQNVKRPTIVSSVVPCPNSLFKKNSRSQISSIMRPVGEIVNLAPGIQISHPEFLFIDLCERDESSCRSETISSDPLLISSRKGLEVCEKLQNRCNDCKKKFVLKSSVAFHAKNHHGAPTYSSNLLQCDFCSHVCFRSDVLRMHIRMLHGYRLNHSHRLELFNERL